MGVASPAAQTVRDIIEASRYLVLATANAAGRPWSSPVYFALIGAGQGVYMSAVAKPLEGDGEPRQLCDTTTPEVTQPALNA